MSIIFKSPIRPAFKRRGRCSVCDNCSEGPCVTHARDKAGIYVVFENHMPKLLDRVPCVEDWNGDGPEDHAEKD